MSSAVCFWLLRCKDFMKYSSSPCVLEIGTGKSISLISKLGQETHAPVSIISHFRRWSSFLASPPAANGVNEKIEVQVVSFAPPHLPPRARLVL